MSGDPITEKKCFLHPADSLTQRGETRAIPSSQTDAFPVVIVVIGSRIVAAVPNVIGECGHSEQASLPFDSDPICAEPMGVKPAKKPSFVRAGVVISLGALLWLLFFQGTPGEKALVRRFEKHRAAFNELKELMSTNSPGQLLRHDGAVWSLEHYQRYRALLRQTGVIRAFQTGSEFSFVMVEPAPKKKGARIAIAWLDEKPERVLTLLEDFRKTGSHPESACWLLEDHWYLWIQEQAAEKP